MCNNPQIATKLETSRPSSTVAKLANISGIIGLADWGLLFFYAALSQGLFNTGTYIFLFTETNLILARQR